MFNATETALFVNLIHCSFMAQSTAFTIGKYFRKTGLGIAKIVTTKTIETLPLMTSNVADYRIKRHFTVSILQKIWPNWDCLWHSEGSGNDSGYNVQARRSLQRF